ncbi:hypothetical protein EG327_006035 [Venturia inaequalis]|uniref:Uncharacterized protein n=1 Tax=Venturia inaequalis TaxID=5025 RepID=A0A8H3Z727_VENIN|nr:hypothetical protein EG327_006035 [Venturia inaequalis]
MTPQLSPSFPKSFEEGIDRWDGPLWPNQDHFELRKGETEVLPHDYKVARSHINEITAHEDGIDNRSIPLQPGQDHIQLRKGETEVSPKRYRVVNGGELVPLTSEKNNNEITAHEDGIDNRSIPLQPGQDHIELRKGETEVSPKGYRAVNGGELIPLTSEKNNDEKDKPKVEIEIVGYEDGIDGWDGPMWPGQDHAGLREGETEVLPEVYRVTKGLKLGVFEE